MMTLGTENVDEPLFVATAVDVSVKCFIFHVFDEGGYLHCQEGNYIFVDPSHPGLQSDCDLTEPPSLLLMPRD